ncbi:MAG: Rieske 2Fe-2S domain-containing protein [SAR202 cluster bacterium]|nr:Rieske 2Fe-2S domain-containing protein [SAR202 cluster bacterium]
MVDVVQRAAGQGPMSGAEKVPNLNGDIRHLIPKLGLRNYWYPLITAKRVPKRRPIQLRLLGEDLVVFRDKRGEAVTLTDICPHRGARLSEGHVHWAGTVACPYHGWVFDEEGRNVAVLSEGPESRVCGKPGTEAKKYPTRTLKGMVFVWIGEEQSAPIEEDVPEEFFDDDSLILFGEGYWTCNWEVALENSMDAHVNYLHRNALVVLRGEYYSRVAAGEYPVYVANGFAGDVTKVGRMTPSDKNAYFDHYPNGWRWPKSNWRRLWTWALKWNVMGAQRNVPSARSPRWSGGHHLPGMFRAEFAYDLYTRMVVPVEEKLSRLWYYHCTRPRNGLQRWWHTVLYYIYHRWMIEWNFSMQDNSVMNNQRYDTPEFLSRTDAEVVQWRRLVVTKAFGGRKAEYQFRNPGNFPAEDVPMELVSRAHYHQAIKDGRIKPTEDVAAQLARQAKRQDPPVAAG